MSFLPSEGEKIRRCRVLPWLHFSAAILVVVTNALFSAVHSPLGQEISAGESPGFAWIRANITPWVGFGLVYLILICWIQLRQMRQSSLAANRWLPIFDLSSSPQYRRHCAAAFFPTDRLSAFSLCGPVDIHSYSGGYCLPASWVYLTSIINR